MLVIPEILKYIMYNYYTFGLLFATSSTIIYINNNHYINKIGMTCAWNGMRIVSKFQIWYNNMFTQLCSYCQSKDDRTLSIVCEGSVKKVCILHKDDKKYIQQYNNNYDIVIHEYPNSRNSDSIYKRYDSIPITIKETVPIFSLFVIVNIKHDGKSYPVENINSLTIPKTKIFDRAYTQWYMCKFHNLTIYDDDYEIELLDQTMQELSFNHTKFIKIHEKHSTIEDNVPSDVFAWRTILTQSDIDDSSNKINNIKLSDIKTPPLNGKFDENRVTTPISLASNGTDNSFELIENSEAN